MKNASHLESLAIGRRACCSSSSGPKSNGGEFPSGLGLSRPSPDGNSPPLDLGPEEDEQHARRPMASDSRWLAFFIHGAGGTCGALVRADNKVRAYQCLARTFAQQASIRLPPHHPALAPIRNRTPACSVAVAAGETRLQFLPACPPTHRRPSVWE